MAALIRVTGAHATLSGIRDPAEVLQAHLSVLHPGRFYSRAFKEKRWNGRVNLASGSTFPAGFVQRIRAVLDDRGQSPTVRSRGGISFPPESVSADCLEGITLWDHQLEAVHAVLQHPRGILHEPTGSGKTAMMAASARFFWEEKGWRSLVVVPRKGLAEQTRSAFDSFFGGTIPVGIAGDGRREEGAVVVATAQTLINFKAKTVKGRGRVAGDPWLRDLIEETDVLFLDECHRASSKSWYEIAMACPAMRRYGFSGTPIVADVLDDMNLEGATGRIVHHTESVSLVQKGLAAKPKIAMVMSLNASGPALPRVPAQLTSTKRLTPKLVDLPYADAYTKGIVQNSTLNESVVAATRWMVKRGRRVLVMCRRKEHFLNLQDLLEVAGVRHAALWGETVTEERLRAKHAFRDGEIDCILATTIFDEGEDIAGVGGIVLAEGVKAITSTLQRIGRGTRGDTEDVWVVDFVPTNHPTLQDHAHKRCVEYENASYEVVVVDDWPAKLGRLPRALLPFESWEATLESALLAEGA